MYSKSSKEASDSDIKVIQFGNPFVVGFTYLIVLFSWKEATDFHSMSNGAVLNRNIKSSVSSTLAMS